MKNNYEDMIKEEWENFKNNKPYPNIMLLGQTGCGKSSLINLVFGKELAEVNNVSRGTDRFKTYFGKDSGLNVNLIDSRGYEMEDGKNESFENYIKAVKTKISDSLKESLYNKIHIIWYCISVASQRIQPYDIEIMKILLNDPELKNHIGIIFTKCDEDDECGSIAKTFRNIIDSELGYDIPSFEVSTDQYLILDLNKLINWSADQLDDDDLKAAFISSQIQNLREKQKSAAKLIAFYSSLAAVIGAVPIPIADSALLIPLQITMATNIVYLYGMDGLAHIPSAVISDIIVSSLGKSIAGDIIKLIPEIGTIAGATINAGVAAAITSALGFAFSQICYTSCEKIAKGESIDILNIFSNENIRQYTEEYFKNPDNKIDSNILKNLINKEHIKQYADKYLKKYKK